eukprot:jgi/Chlat1/5875/Chrsp4S06387
MAQQVGVASLAPITAERPPATKLPELQASATATAAGPKEGASKLTVLQQHVAYFDLDGDGVIFPYDTYVGFRKIGFNVFLSCLSVLIIHGSFSWVTQDTWLPSPAFTILVKNIHHAKHGSDSEVYDTEGRFVPYKFEDIFSKYDRQNKGALTFPEIMAMVKGNRNVADFFGWFGAIFEWGTTYLLCKDERGLVSKERIRGVYDGSLFTQMELARKASAQAQMLVKKAN